MTARPFVIVSHLRSGTHMLRTSLESHPAVRCQAEPFNSDNPDLPYPLTVSSQEILDRWVYTPQPAGIEHVGFVLQSYHPNGLAAFEGIRQAPGWRDVWDLLVAMPDLRVILLVRDNLLRRHLSHVLARRRWYWHSWDAQAVERTTFLGHKRPPSDQIGTTPPPVGPVELDPERLQLDFEEILRLRARARSLFEDHPLLQVRYEDLCEDFEHQAHRLLDFLELSPAPLEPAVKKMERRPLSQAIANYDALRTHFADTPWAGFFDG